MLQIPDSTHTEDRINLPITAMLTIEAYLTVRPQIVLFQQNYLDELDSIPTYIADTIYAAEFPESISHSKYSSCL